jgi:hypothetical protein
MSTYVLVPGAFHGGWAWESVARVLEVRGHRAIPLTLTGLGERKHLLTPAVGVDTHIEDVVNSLVYRDLSDVALVLHSYSGVLAGPVVDKAEGRVTRVVLAGGFLAHPGESNFSVEPLASQEAFLERWGITDPALVAYVRPRLTDFPLRCSSDPVDFDPAVLAALPRSYIEHTDPPLPALGESIERARQEGWQMRTIAACHDFMLEKPEETADILENC